MFNAAYATEVETLQAEYDCNKRAAMVAFEHEWEGKNQPRLERNTKRARRTQIANIRSAVDQFEKSLQSDYNFVCFTCLLCPPA